MNTTAIRAARTAVVAALVAVVALILSVALAGDRSAAETVQSETVAVEQITEPDATQIIADDEYYETADLFRVQDGDMWMIGTDGVERADVDWYVGTTVFEDGDYLLTTDRMFMQM